MHEKQSRGFPGAQGVGTAASPLHSPQTGGVGWGCRTHWRTHPRGPPWRARAPRIQGLAEAVLRSTLGSGPGEGMCAYTWSRMSRGAGADLRPGGNVPPFQQLAHPSAAVQAGSTPGPPGSVASQTQELFKCKQIESNKLCSFVALATCHQVLGSHQWLLLARRPACPCHSQMPQWAVSPAALPVTTAWGAVQTQWQGLLSPATLAL